MYIKNNTLYSVEIGRCTLVAKYCDIGKFLFIEDAYIVRDMMNIIDAGVVSVSQRVKKVDYKVKSLKNMNKEKDKFALEQENTNISLVLTNEG